MTELENCCAGILKFIEKNDNFLVTAHLSADGDAYGAALAIAYFLKLKGKNYRVVFHDQQKDDKYKFLQGWEDIVSYSDALLNDRFDAAIVVDVPSRARIGNPAKLLPAPEKCIKIDHHPEEDEFSSLSLVDVRASSTCQLVYELVVRSALEMDFHLANHLMCGIMYDTGRFSFSNTSARDFEIAAHLASLGVSSNIIAAHLFFSNSLEALKVVGYGLANMETYLNGKVCLIYLPYEVMKKAVNLDIDELANYSLAVKDVEVGLYVRHAEPTLTKISFRSKGKVDVNRVAKKFGGGGHVHAAGCRVNSSPEKVIPEIIAEIDAQLDNQA
jgi:phosphoesterase RecJ-like protein